MTRSSGMDRWFIEEIPSVTDMQALATSGPQNQMLVKSYWSAHNTCNRPTDNDYAT